MSSYGGFICLACGHELSQALRVSASLRCHECRRLDAPVQIAHARRVRERNRCGELTAA
jgi:hypothetical protein